MTKFRQIAPLIGERRIRNGAAFAWVVAADRSFFIFTVMANNIGNLIIIIDFGIATDARCGNSFGPTLVRALGVGNESKRSHL
jgi:hypothetical protein